MSNPTLSPQTQTLRNLAMGAFLCYSVLMKKCSKCNIVKPFKDFCKESHAKSGLRSRCKSCRNYDKKQYRKTEKAVMQDRKYKKSAQYKLTHNTEKRKRSRRNNHLIKNFGLSIESYEKLLKMQKGVCAICLQVCSTGKELAVDHCHSTGRIRGLLCTKCNMGIGFLDDDIKLLTSAIKYLSS